MQEQIGNDVRIFVWAAESFEMQEAATCFGHSAASDTGK